MFNPSNAAAKAAGRALDAALAAALKTAPPARKTELAPGERVLRVATWNVWFGESQSSGVSAASDWQRWAALLAEAIAGGAEVICLQEVTEALHAAMLMCQTIVGMYMPAEQISESEIPALFQGGYIVPQYIMGGYDTCIWVRRRAGISINRAWTIEFESEFARRGLAIDLEVNVPDDEDADGGDGEADIAASPVPGMTAKVRVATVHLESMATNVDARKLQLDTIIPKLRSEPFGGGGSTANRAASRYFSRLAEAGTSDAAALPDTVVLCGDFNLCATTAENLTISGDGSLHDLWAVLRPGDPGWSEDSEVNGMLKVLKPEKEQKFRYDRIVLIQPGAAAASVAAAPAEEEEDQESRLSPLSPLGAEAQKQKRKRSSNLFRRSSGESATTSSMPPSPSPSSGEAPAGPAGQTLSAELQVNAVAVERLGLKAVDAAAELPLWPSDHFGLIGTLRLQPSVSIEVSPPL